MNTNDRETSESAEIPDSHVDRPEVQKNSREAEQIPEPLPKTGAVASGNPAGRPKRPLRPDSEETDKQLDLASPAMRPQLQESLSYHEDKEDEYATAPIKDKGIGSIPIRKRYPKLPEDLTTLQGRTVLRQLAKQGLTNKFDHKIDELDIQRRHGAAPEIIADQETEPIDPDDLEAWTRS